MVKAVSNTTCICTAATLVAARTIIVTVERTQLEIAGNVMIEAYLNSINRIPVGSRDHIRDEWRRLER